MNTLPVSKLEAARMALADTGFDPSCVRVVGDILQVASRVPLDITWGLRQVVFPERPAICLACQGILTPAQSVDADTDAARERCLAWRPFIRDCGLDR